MARRRRPGPRRLTAALLALWLLSLLATQWAGLVHRVEHRPVPSAPGPAAGFAAPLPALAGVQTLRVADECLEHPAGHGHTHGHEHDHGHAPGTDECRLLDALTLADASAAVPMVLLPFVAAAAPETALRTVRGGAAPALGFLARGPPPAG